ncbi:TonB-dependent receptor [Pseudomonas sp. A-1]|uniref:TonB-dependent receptor n=1 Tax=Pseudomonas sp. A-1 TaxID=1821274 RepID=UPI0010A61CDE|nr:TonB-dependent receptor [Pseudomonas sp. A-1]THG82832.1 TonB-dependent receptor [Pseudomonas sp. A-1]
MSVFARPSLAQSRLSRPFALNPFQRRWWPAHAALLGALALPLQAAEPESTESAEEEVAPLMVTFKPAEVRERPAAATLGATEIDVKARSAAGASTSDSAALLRGAAGVSLNNAGGISSLPSIRGLADDRLRIKVDGMDLVASCPNHMNPALSYIDPSNLGKLQVFAGITPVSLGGDSIGGTIVAESLAPEFAAAGETLDKGSVGAFLRSNNDARGGNVSLMHANDAFNIRYAGSYSKANNYMAGDDFKTSTATGRPGESSALDEVASTAYETRSHQLTMAYKLGEDLLELSLGQHEVPQELFPNQRMDLTDNTQQRINLRYLSRFAWGSLETRVYRETVDHEMDFGPDKRFWYGSASGAGTACGPIGATCAAGMPMNSESTTLGASAKASIELNERDLLRLGSEYQRYRLDDYWPASGGGMWPGTFENINDGKRDRLALFGEWEREIDPAWLTLVGLRYEHVSSSAGVVHGYGNAMGSQIPDAAAFNASDRSQSDDNWDFTALARYNHDANLDVEFGYARKVRSPNLYERYTWSTWPMAAVMNNFVGDGNGYVGDIGLEPETAHTVSATLDWHSADRRHELKVTPFYTHVDDYIDAVARPGWTAGRFNVLQYANQTARIYGVDVSGRMPLMRNALGQWGLEALVNYSDGKNRDSGDELYNIMPLNTTVALTQQLGGWSNSLEMLSVTAKNDGSDVRNEIETAGYTLFNLRLSHNWDQVRVDAGVENLADKFYYLPTGGAYTAQGRTMSINGIPSGIGVPGMGRTFYTGVTVSF